MTLPDLEHLIYEAAVVPEQWPEVLETLSAFGGSFGTVLLAANDQNQVHSIASPQARPFWEQWVEGGWTTKSQRAPRLLARPRQGWVRDTDILTIREIETLPEYVNFLLPRGFKWGAAAAIPMPTGDTAIFSMERRVEQGPFDTETVAGLDALFPHLARAAMIASRLSFERARTAVETLALLELPAVALARNGAVVVANDLFEQEWGLWTTRGRDRLVLHDQRASRILSATLDQIASASGIRSIALESVDGTDRAVLHVLPVRRTARDIFGRATSIAVLTKASRKVAQSPALLRAIFDLTPTESEIACELAVGTDLKRIAKGRGVSLETLRFHLKRIREKTGCRRQAELATMLSRLMSV
ncbi:helix-turn-helix transcriptional regulator [Phreatobacter sp.]|uniref:helix-turn-helix transcriptional regulator n=1 Tax=Phreatobacter sp. TaxID=1966341 RepID=UPI003F70017F